MCLALGARFQTQPTQIPQPRVVVLHDFTVEGLERGCRCICNRPSSVHQAQQHVNRAGVSLAPFLKRQRLSVPPTERPVSSSQELCDVRRADSLCRKALAVTVAQKLTRESRIRPLDRGAIPLALQVKPEFVDQRGMSRVSKC